jgi:hypothetical protein
VFLIYIVSRINDECMKTISIHISNYIGNERIFYSTFTSTIQMSFQYEIKYAKNF